MADVYWLWDQEGELLYVGTSLTTASRLQSHRNGQTWWHEVSQITVDHYDSEADAYRAERHAISTECPRYNVENEYVIDFQALMDDDSKLVRVARWAEENQVSMSRIRPFIAKGAIKADRLRTVKNAPYYALQSDLDEWKRMTHDAS